MNNHFPRWPTSSPAQYDSVNNNASWQRFDSECVTKRIMLVASCRLFRDGLAKILEQQNRIIIGSCLTLSEALSVLVTLDPPDIFIVQAESGEYSSLFAQIQQVKIGFQNAHWLVLSSDIDAKFLKRAVVAGIDACISNASSAEVLRLVSELVLLGHSFVKTDLAQVLMELDQGADHTQVTKVAAKSDTPAFVIPPHCDVLDADQALGEEVVQGSPKTSRPHDLVLSVRELEILKQLVEGQPNKTIARNLDIAEATVKVHVKALFRKMHVANRTQAAISATQYLRLSDAKDRAMRATELQ